MSAVCVVAMGEVLLLNALLVSAEHGEASSSSSETADGLAIQSCTTLTPVPHSTRSQVVNAELPDGESMYMQTQRNRSQ